MRQLLQHAAMPLVEELVQLDARVQHAPGAAGAARLQERSSREQIPLLPHLSPQLLACLLAEVAAGLLVPG